MVAATKGTFRSSGGSGYPLPVTDDSNDARLDALLDEHQEWAEAEHRAMRARSPQVTDFVILLVVNPAGTIPLGPVTMDVMRERIARDQPNLLQELASRDRTALRFVVLDSGRWRVRVVAVD